jgi:hypothetical protein
LQLIFLSRNRRADDIAPLADLFFLAGRATE